MTMPASGLPQDGCLLRTFGSVRRIDTDRRGLVSNAVFSTFLESRRMALLYDADAPSDDPEAAFVIARLVLDFRHEVNWLGRPRGRRSNHGDPRDHAQQ